jgi:glutamate/aspartate transport system substrate-binding protein
MRRRGSVRAAYVATNARMPAPAAGEASGRPADEPIRLQSISFARPFLARRCRARHRVACPSEPRLKYAAAREDRSAQSIHTGESMRHRFRAALVIAIVFTALPALAQELAGTLKKIKETGAISVGYAEQKAPFSYVDTRKNVVGYSIDICNNVIGAIKLALKKPDLKVQMLPIKAEDAVSFVRSGAIDLHCGPVANTFQSKSQVDFGMTYYIVQYRYASKESAHMMEIDDMGGKSIATQYGSPSMRALEALESARGLGIRILPANTNELAYAMFDRGDADAVAMDDVSLAQFVARSKELVMTSSATLGPVEPYSLVFARGDTPFRTLVLESMTRFFRSGGVQPSYQKWFQAVNAPSGINLSPTISAPLEKVFRNPTDSADPAYYK